MYYFITVHVHIYTKPSHTARKLKRKTVKAMVRASDIQPE